MTILAKNLRRRICIGDNESTNNIRVLGIESTSIVLRILHRDVRKSPSFNWDYKLITDLGTNASLVRGRRLLTKLVPL